MPIISCKLCNTKFYIKPSHLMRGNGKYCSNKCAGIARKKGRFVNCDICKKEIWRTPQHLDHSKSKKYFCSKSCQTLWRNSILYIGANHPNWKGGFTTYRDMMLKIKGKKICNRCAISDIRLLSVHHLDENRKNNRIENLTWLCYNCHYLIHKDVTEKNKFMGDIVK